MATLKNLVDETTNIKNELKTCYTNLVNNLSVKDVEVSSGDKLGDLVDKISLIATPVKTIISSNPQILITESTNSSTVTFKKSTNYDYKLYIMGDIRISLNVGSATSTSNYNPSVLNIQHIRSGNIITTRQLSRIYGEGYAISTFNILNVMPKDIIRFCVTASSPNDMYVYKGKTSGLCWDEL